MQLSLFVNYNLGAHSFIVQPAPNSKILLNLKDIEQMVFVTDIHILVCMRFVNHRNKQEEKKLWRVFDVQDGTLVIQNETA